MIGSPSSTFGLRSRDSRALLVAAGDQEEIAKQTQGETGRRGCANFLGRRANDQKPVMIA
jgi:hypothetical protein